MRIRYEPHAGLGFPKSEVTENPWRWKLFGMAFKVFSFRIPMTESDHLELNQYISSCRISTVTHHVVSDSRGAWAVFVTESIHEDHRKDRVPPASGRVDYSKALGADDYAVFCEMREERKKLAEEEGKPLYVIFNNDELAELARTRPKTLGQMQALDGLAQRRVERYGERMLNILRDVSSRRSQDEIGSEGVS